MFMYIVMHHRTCQRMIVFGFRTFLSHNVNWLICQAHASFQHLPLAPNQGATPPPPPSQHEIVHREKM